MKKFLILLAALTISAGSLKAGAGDQIWVEKPAPTPPPPIGGPTPIR